MSSAYALKVGDLEPALVITVTDVGYPVDIHSAVSARFVMREVGQSTPKVNRLVAITDDGTLAKRGLVTVAWQAGDTDTAGDYQAEVEIEWTSGRKQTFPGEGFLLVRIEPTIG